MTLEEATRALREEGAMDATRKRALRDRVLKAPRKRPLRAIRWVMPIAAVLAAASVWASVTREHRHAPQPIATTPIATTTIAPIVSVAPVAPVASVVTPLVESGATAPVRSVTRTIKLAPDDSEHRALRAYREAERLQFDDKDYTRALDAWDRYIPLAGKSPLLVDAKWQRALCLVRLGRPEAREALEPFANGELGAYRQNEARTILDTLR